LSLAAYLATSVQLGTSKEITTAQTLMVAAQLNTQNFVGHKLIMNLK